MESSGKPMPSLSDNIRAVMAGSVKRICIPGVYVVFRDEQGRTVIEEFNREA